MSGITVNPLGIYFEDGNEKKQILDFTDFLSNKSRIPFHTLAIQKQETVPSFFEDLLKKLRENIANITSISHVRLLTLDALVAAKLVESSAPIKIAEIGATEGSLSYSLAEVLGKFNPNSQVCFISNTLGNNSSNQCLDYILKSERLPEFSMMYSDYEKTNLGDEVFDIVILNGSAYFTNHYNVIKEAERITKKNGLLLCCSCGDFLLESIFKLIFTSREEYCLTSSDVILSAQKNGTSWESSLSESHLSKLPVVLQRLKNILLASEENLAPYRQIRQELETLISASMDEYNIPLKVQLINLKEALLNYTSHISTIHKTYFKEELITQISGFSFEGNN